MLEVSKCKHHAIVYRGIECQQILVSAGALEPVGGTKYINK
jgi:hypothetical protein